MGLRHLVREACREKYGVARAPARMEAVDELAGLGLPVGPLEKMNRESVPEPGEGPP